VKKTSSPKTKKATRKARKHSFTKKVSAAVHRTLVIEKLPGYFLLTCFLLSFFFMSYIMWPFVAVLFLSGVLVISFYPVYRWFLRIVNAPWFASILTCLFVVFVILIPITVFALLITSEAIDVYNVTEAKIQAGDFDQYLKWTEGGMVYDLVQRVENVINLDEIDVKANILGWIKSLKDPVASLASQTLEFFSALVNLMVSLFVMLFAMFYFFKDGDKIVEKIGYISPLPSLYEDELFMKIGDMVKAIMSGVFLTAIIQGVVAGIGYAIAGIPSAIFWGTLTAFFSLVPLVGTAVVWVPMVIFFIATGSYGLALFVAIWGVLVVGSVDNFVRPLLIGGKAHVYPLLTFFVILGGIWTMGFQGVIVGPLVLMVFLSFLHIYEAEYSKILKQ
jgi:predicted PurR-regulated permease PerM